MCWVMPPNSCSVTLVFRIASSSDVFPWSTCPMTVTTGGRGRSCDGSISSSTSSRSSADRMSASKPNRAATALTLSWSSGWLIVAMTPMPTSSRMTSPIFRPMRSASSETVTDSGSFKIVRGPASAAGTAAAAGFSTSVGAGVSRGAGAFSTAAAGATTRSGAAGAGSSRRGLSGTTLPSVAGFGAGSTTFGWVGSVFSEGRADSDGAASRAAGASGSFGRTGGAAAAAGRSWTAGGLPAAGFSVGAGLTGGAAGGAGVCAAGAAAGRRHGGGDRRARVHRRDGLLELRRDRRLDLGRRRSPAPPSRPSSPWRAPCP